ncbi:hypothetical protein [Clostridium botulinum]|nr:hypothetical protein [Clostridium botulinum]KAI3349178.1 hypothetical protein CIT18_10195 [Clostridium botulinum]
MEATKKLKIECPYEILKIEDIKILCKPNEHGKVYLKCLIDDSVNFKYSIEASTNDKICVYEEIENTDLNNNENTVNEEKRTTIFNGIIDNIKTTNINGIYYLELEGSSSSSLLDIEKRTRSFQDINMSYDELINEILKNYEGYGFTQCMNRPMSIEKPLFQYKETDYEFLKRIGSYLGLELICDVVNTNNIIYFGKPSLKFYALNNEINYKASKDLEKYYKVLTLGIDFHDTDFFYYEVMIREKMDIGDLIKFKERDFYINQYYGQMHNRELIYKYRFCRKNGIWQEKIYNEKLKGISIEGKVLAVDGERVKLHLNIDETQDISKASWFKYAPPTGNIMYAMPNIGESVMLYFPNRYDEPIVTGCVRKNGNSCSKISNTNNRYFSTESGNNLDILPGAINFHRSGMNVNLNDENGINISSSGNLSLGASDGISLSGGSVSISGSNKVLVQKNKSSYISLEGECYNQSNAVYENGSCRETYEPFTDDDPQNGVAEALAEQMKMNEAALLAAADGANAVVGDVSTNLDPLGLLKNKPWSKLDTNLITLKNECYITKNDGKGTPITQWEIDVMNMHNAPGEYKLQYFGEYLKDRWYVPAKNYFNFMALNYGMEPKYAKLYSEFTVGMIGEFGITILSSGVKAAKAIISGKTVFSKSEIIAGSGIGNLKKGAGNTKKINYKKVFFDEYPDLEGKVVVHHGVEQQVLKKPQTQGLFTPKEMHSLDNLRGIPKQINSDLHLSKIRKEWNRFYREFPNPTKEQLLNKRLEIDNKYGDLFNPPIK